MVNLENYVNVRILVCCLLVGFILKMWIQDESNRWIPTIVTILGLCLSLLINGISLESGLIGAISGLASTGMHQLVKQLVIPKKE